MKELMGKLSKPQRSRKHKKLKPVDPFYTGNRSVQKNKQRYNREPLKDSEHELTQRETLKVNSKPRRRARKTHQAQQWNVEQGVPEFRRRVGETERDFLHRVDCETLAVIEQSQFNDKYHRTEPLHTDDVDDSRPATATRREKRKLRLQRKKADSVEKKRQRHEDRCGGFARLQDEVKFGEVVLQPPVLSVAPRRRSSNNSQETRRRHKSLLLSQLLTTGGSTANKRQLHSRRSMAERVMLDSERQRAVTLYRQLKASQLH